MANPPNANRRLRHHRTHLTNSKIRFVYESSPGILDVEDEINAWVEQWEEYPPLIVIDNLLDLAAGESDAEHVKFKALLKELKTLARDTGSCIMVLHHMLESGGRGNARPLPRDAIAAKVTQTPAQIISVAAEGNFFYYSIIKDRNGADDATAQKYYTLRSDGERCIFSQM